MWASIRTLDIRPRLPRLACFRACQGAGRRGRICHGPNSARPRRLRFRLSSSEIEFSQRGQALAGLVFEIGAVANIIWPRPASADAFFYATNLIPIALVAIIVIGLLQLGRVARAKD